MNVRTDYSAQKTSFKGLRLFLETYKTKPCLDPDCPFNQPNPEPFSDIRECPNYHGPEDKRRNPFDKQTPTKLVYSHYMKELDPGGCLNDVEFMYHPLNFLRFECQNHKPSRKIICKVKYCPFYHQNSERRRMKALAGTLEPYEDIFTKVKTELDKLDTFVRVELTRFDFKPAIKSKEPSAKVPQLQPRSANKMTVAARRPRKNSSANMWIVKKKDNNFFVKGCWVNGIGKNSRKLTVHDTTDQDNLQYYMGQEVNMFEDLNHEFKNFNSLDVKTAANYICGFLNSFGGKLFFGIDNDGFVKGIFLSR